MTKLVFWGLTVLNRLAMTETTWYSSEIANDLQKSEYFVFTHSCILWWRGFNLSSYAHFLTVCLLLLLHQLVGFTFAWEFSTEHFVSIRIVLDDSESEHARNSNTDCRLSPIKDHQQTLLFTLGVSVIHFFFFLNSSQLSGRMETFQHHMFGPLSVGIRKRRPSISKMIYAT